MLKEKKSIAAQGLVSEGIQKGKRIHPHNVVLKGIQRKSKPIFFLVVLDITLARGGPLARSSSREVRIRDNKGTLFSVVYFRRGTLPKKCKRALLGDLVGVSNQVFRFGETAWKMPSASEALKRCLGARWVARGTHELKAASRSTCMCVYIIRIYVHVHLLMSSFVHSFVHSFIVSFVHSFAHSLIRSFVHSFICSFVH